MTECVITSSVLIVVVLVVRSLFRGKISRRLHYALWGLVLLRLLLPFSLFDSPISIMNAVDLSRAEYEVEYRSVPVRPYQEISVENYAASLGIPVSEVVDLDLEVATYNRMSMPLADVLKLTWLIGGLLVGMWFAGTNIVFYRRLQKTRTAYPDIECKLPVYVADQIASPCLFGVLHPVVYLTPKAAENKVSTRHVLVHELCHYRHKDHIWSILRGLCLAVWWWNPLVWAAAIFSKEDSELACDEAVIEQVGDSGRLAYGHTLINMIAIRKSPTSLMCAATTMSSGKRGIKERLNVIIKNPKSFVPAMVAVVLIALVSVACTFTGARAKEQDLSMLNIANLASVSHQRAELLVSRAPGHEESLSISARAVADYLDSVKWTEKKMSSPLELSADLQIEWDKGHELRFYHSEPRLAMVRMNEQWRYYTIGKGDYEKALALLHTVSNMPGETAQVVSYSLMQLGKESKTLRTIELLAGDDAQLAEDVVMNYMVKSAAWPGVSINTLDECYLVRAIYSDGTIADYYAYLLDGKAVMQNGKDGFYSRIDDGLYEKLVNLAQSKGKSVGPSSLEDSISNAIMSANANRYKNGDYAAEAHTVLKTVGDGNTTTVYAMALYLQFGFAGGAFAETGGSHMPVAITFVKNSADEYQLAEYWVPQNGTDYAPSIKQKFPADVSEDALNTQKYVVAHTQACYAQAIQYGNVDTGARIEYLVEVITSSPSLMSNPHAYIQAHPIEYRELIYYGSHTLRYSFSLFEQGGQTGLEGHILATACRSILGDAEDIDLLASTGQDWYDAFKEHAKNLHRQYGDDYMKNNMPGSWLLLQMLPGR